MAPESEDDWSDSDDDAMSEVETNVFLGVPDGSIDAMADIQDAAVSRIGGLPVRDISLCTIRLAHEMYFDWSFNLRRSCPRENRRSLLRAARYAKSRWSCSFRCGAL